MVSPTARAITAMGDDIQAFMLPPLVLLPASCIAWGRWSVIQSPRLAAFRPTPAIHAMAARLAGLLPGSPSEFLANFGESSYFHMDEPAKPLYVFGSFR